MKVPRSFAKFMLIGFFVFGLLVAGMPDLVLAQPHPCVLDGSGNPVQHVSASPKGLGGATTTYTFKFARDCTTPSGALTLKWSITRYDNGQLICQAGQGNFPSGSPSVITVVCAGTYPTGAYPKVKVALQYQTTSGGSWMPHTDLFANQQ